MKIAFLSSIYPRHCDDIYKKDKSLSKRSYDEQCKTIEKETICSMGQWPNHLCNMGFCSIMICKNNHHAQSKWCEENDFKQTPVDPEFEIVEEQLYRFEPDILFIFGPSYYAEKNRLSKLLKRNTSIKKKICWYGAPEGSLKIFKEYDLVLTNSFFLRDSLRKEMINSEQLNHAFEINTLDLIIKKKRYNKICFLGSLIMGNEWHKQRIEYLQEITKEVNLRIYSEISPIPILDKLKNGMIIYRYKFSKIFRNRFPNNKYLKKHSTKSLLPDFSSSSGEIFNQRLFKPRYGIQMLQKLSEHTLTFNQHIQHTGNNACNMRLYESTGVGCCLLTDHKSNIKSIFEPDHEIITYKTADEAAVKARYLLNNEKEAQEIALAGQKRTLKDHTTEKQVNHLVQHINSLFS